MIAFHGAARQKIGSFLCEFAQQWKRHESFACTEDLHTIVTWGVVFLQLCMSRVMTDDEIGDFQNRPVDGSSDDCESSQLIKKLFSFSPEQISSFYVTLINVDPTLIGPNESLWLETVEIENYAKLGEWHDTTHASRPKAPSRRATTIKTQIFTLSFNKKRFLFACTRHGTSLRRRNLHKRFITGKSNIAKEKLFCDGIFEHEDMLHREIASIARSIN